MNFAHLRDLSDPELLEELLTAPIQIVNLLCRHNTRAGDIIRSNFWQQRYIRDYGHNYTDTDQYDWKSLYKNYGNIYYSGNFFGRDRQSFHPVSADRKFKQFSSGKEHAIFLDTENKPFAIGNNGYRQLGYNGPSNASNFRLLAEYARSISAGFYDTLIINDQTGALATGHNQYKQISTANSDRVTPIQEIYIAGAAKGAIGRSTFIIDTDYYLWAKGDNTNKQLGLGPNTGAIVTEFTRVPNMTALDVYIGDKFTLVIDTTNNVWTCGYNDNGELGLGDFQRRDTFSLVLNNGEPFKAKLAAAGYDRAFLIDMDNNLWAMGRYKAPALTARFNTPTPTGLRAKRVSCGTNHAVVIDMDNYVWGIGANYFNKLGLSETRFTSEFIKLRKDLVHFKAREVACGDHYTLFLSDINYKEEDLGEGLYMNNFNVIQEMLTANLFERFDIPPGEQHRRRNPNNVIAAFYTGAESHLVEVAYNQSTNTILPPLC